MKTITVDRKKWGRGKSGGYLVNGENGLMCCLGFACNQVSRITRNKMLDCMMPSAVLRRESFLTEVDDDGVVLDNKLADKASAINDSESMSDKMREYKLTRLFKSHGYKIRFVN